jgi:hypothetical protein
MELRVMARWWRIRPAMHNDARFSVGDAEVPGAAHDAGLPAAMETRSRRKTH